MLSGLIANGTRVVVTGLVGAGVYDGMKRVVRSGAVRSATVAGTAWGLRGVRAAETGAEKARLVAGDIVSEARARVGEEASAPGAANSHGHVH